MKTDGIIFDMDGTIWDTCEKVTYSWNVMLKRLGIDKHFETEQLKACMGMLMEDFAAALMPDFEAGYRLDVLKKCCVYENEYIAEVGGDLYPEVRETLETLSRRYPLFIVSNCQAGYIEAFFEAHHMEHLFRDYENPGRSGLDKAGNIRLICDRNNLKHPVYIGDTNGDLNACRLAGVPFVFAAYGFGEVPLSECAAKIDAFCELTELFK